ncbi:hypothetical protein A3L04_02435 [Thermococcus chitonophagus]|uniref:Uncharacterized protein n=1 Tax=Thermococcus chitonophagus TaxID=54262 RepID=A0A160VUC7_9EURY|nr:hypothetical protein [Thermococcus chitonophagus]ASJ16014.1 hypothetical protein A3L04_02435 [Thermococcus chitonophagus]CUX77261.1 hypothetical protein CHITON_0482 [Thermococcus chitonophagus]
MRKVIVVTLILALLALTYFLPSLKYPHENSQLHPSIILGYAYVTPDEKVKLRVLWCLNGSEQVLLKFGGVKKVLVPKDADIEMGEIEGEVVIKPSGDIKGLLFALPEGSSKVYLARVNVKVEFGSSYPLKITKNATTSITLYINGTYTTYYGVEVVNPTNETIKLKGVIFPVQGVKILSFGFSNESIFDVPQEPVNLSRVLLPHAKGTLVIYIQIDREIDGLVFKPKVILEVNGREYPLSVPEMTFVRAICRKEKR